MFVVGDTVIMMECSHCHGQAPDDAAYCPHCGRRLHKGRTFTEEFRVSGEELVSKVKQLIQEGNIRSLRVKQKDKVLLEIPLTIGVVGVLLAPTLAALGALAALITECTIEVEKEA
ncbi:MAG: DUF4342 domain-containing protein [Candidatus Methanofastidiosa archaeon]|jgi:hypothetical protein|nr:DUF4342 domain-containing protein [Candidatus Methanofastidiosa archaeon]